jgi:hypothetical protein
MLSVELSLEEVFGPWDGGHDAWNVGGIIFPRIGVVMAGVSVKTRAPKHHRCS